MSRQLPWHRAEPAPVVLITGVEEVTASRALQAIRSSLRAAHPDLEVTEIDATSYAAGSLLAAAGPSLFGEPRLVIAEHIEHCTDEFLSDALAYLGMAEQDCTLVLRHAGGTRGKRLLSAIKALDSSVVVETPAISRDVDKVEFVTLEFSRAGRRIDASAVRRLVDAFSGDLAELASACGQLLSDVEGPIDAAHVDTYFGGRVETTAFAVADAAIAGRTSEALIGLRRAFATGVDPVPIVAAFAAKVRLLLKVEGARGSSAALAKPLGAAPWQIDRARRESSSWTPAQLVEAIAIVAATDAAVKGAERDPAFAVERMVRAIAGRTGL